MTKKSLKENKNANTRFYIGLGLIVFLVLINSFVKDIPMHLVAIPALIMGVDWRPWIEYLLAKRK